MSGCRYGQECCRYTELVVKSVVVLTILGLLCVPTILFLRSNVQVRVHSRGGGGGGGGGGEGGNGTVFHAADTYN